MKDSLRVSFSGSVLLFVALWWSIVLVTTCRAQDSTTQRHGELAVKAERDELMRNIAISPDKGKVAIVWVRSKRQMTPNVNSGEEQTDYSLWELDIQALQPRRLVEFQNSDTGITQPSWSPDGRWVAFKIFSIQGHSPATTYRTFVVDTKDGDLERIGLPLPYGNYSNFLLRWTGAHSAIIQGGGGQGKESVRFVYDCDAKKMEVTGK